MLVVTLTFDHAVHNWPKKPIQFRKQINPDAVYLQGNDAIKVFILHSCVNNFLVSSQYGFIHGSLNDNMKYQFDYKRLTVKS